MERNQDRDTELFMQISNAAKELGWLLAMPNLDLEDENAELKGLVIGEKSFIDYILAHLD